MHRRTLSANWSGVQPAVLNSATRVPYQLDPTPGGVGTTTTTVRRSAARSVAASMAFNNAGDAGSGPARNSRIVR